MFLTECYNLFEDAGVNLAFEAIQFEKAFYEE